MTFVHSISGFCLCMAVGFAPMAASAYTVNKTGTGAEMKWPVRSVPYRVNASAGPVNASNALQAAMSAWSSVSGAAFQFAYAGSTSSSGEVYDGSNVCSFVNYGASGFVARNTYWSYSDGQVFESDIVFNTYYAWSASGESGKVDVQNTATHELGHSLSLADLYGGGDTEKTMYYSVAYGETKKRTLDADDIAGLVYLYPAPTNKLTVVSAYGGMSPGTVTTNWGAVLSQWVTNSPVMVGGSTQLVCTAGVVVSNAYSQISTTNVTLTLTNNAVLTWQWQPRYKLTAQADGSGSMSVTNGWYEAGSNAVVSATAGSYWHFTGWSGDTNGCWLVGNVITATMSRARSLIAHFSETLAPLGTPESWLAQYGLTNDPPAAEELKDNDGDGVPAWQEYVADTDPANPSSVLKISGITLDASTVRVEYRGGRWAKQYLDVRDNLAATNSVWTCVMTNDVLPTLITNTWTQLGVTNPVLFYRIRVAR